MDTYERPDIPVVGEVTLVFSDDGNEESLFRIVELWWTEAGCPTDDLFEQEQVVQQILSDAIELDVDALRLVIITTDGQALTFSPSEND